MNSVASYEAGRRLLEQGRRAMASGRPERAGEAFASAAACFAGPTSLLGGGHAWRGLAEVAVLQARFEEANVALDAAERLFQLGRAQQVALPPDPEVERSLNEGLLVVGVARADVALRQGDLPGARARLGQAAAHYSASGQEGRADLWRLVARLSEREGRWNAARMEWRRVAKACAACGDDRGRTDALVRLTEVLILMNRPEKADAALSGAEEAARSTMDPALLGRVHMAKAGLLELNGDTEAAWERWESALEALVHAGGILQGLARVRMSLLAARYRPLEASFLLKEGLKHLLDGQHPDALGLVHHQIALVALAMNNQRVAALAVVGAEAARGFRGVATQSILSRALAQAGEGATVDDLARLEGLVGTPLGTRRSAMELCDRLANRPQTPRPSAARELRPTSKLLWSEGADVREEPLPHGLVTVGSRDDADIRVPADGVSVSIRKDASGVRVVVDPMSPQPVLLDGHAIRGEHFLTDGDVLTLGDLELRHVLPPAPVRPPTKTQPPAPERPQEVPPEPVEDDAPEPVQRRGSGRLYGLVFVLGAAAVSALLGALAGALLVLLFAVS
ncbi:MAG: FHA domain-containing protein [Myxococcota bacterium]